MTVRQSHAAANLEDFEELLFLPAGAGPAEASYRVSKALGFKALVFPLDDLPHAQFGRHQPEFTAPQLNDRLEWIFHQARAEMPDIRSRLRECRKIAGQTGPCAMPLRLETPKIENIHTRLSGKFATTLGLMLIPPHGASDNEIWREQLGPLGAHFNHCFEGDAGRHLILLQQAGQLLQRRDHGGSAAEPAECWLRQQDSDLFALQMLNARSARLDASPDASPGGKAAAQADEAANLRFAMQGLRQVRALSLLFADDSYWNSLILDAARYGTPAPSPAACVLANYQLQQLVLERHGWQPAPGAEDLPDARFIVRCLFEGSLDQPRSAKCALIASTQAMLDIGPGAALRQLRAIVESGAPLSPLAERQARLALLAAGTLLPALTAAAPGAAETPLPARVRLNPWARPVGFYR